MISKAFFLVCAMMAITSLFFPDHTSVMLGIAIAVIAIALIIRNSIADVTIRELGDRLEKYYEWLDERDDCINEKVNFTDERVGDTKRKILSLETNIVNLKGGELENSHNIQLTQKYVLTCKEDLLLLLNKLNLVLVRGEDRPVALDEIVDLIKKEPYKKK